MCTAPLDWISTQCCVSLSTRVHFAKYVPHEMIEVTPSPAQCLPSVWWSMLMSLCSWWKCGSYLNVLRKKQKWEPPCLLLTLTTVWSFWVSPCLIVFPQRCSCWEVELGHAFRSSDGPHSPLDNTLGEQWHWPDRGIWLIVTKQSKRSPISGPGPWPY